MAKLRSQISNLRLDMANLRFEVANLKSQMANLSLSVRSKKRNALQRGEGVKKKDKAQVAYVLAASIMPQLVPKTKSAKQILMKSSGQCRYYVNPQTQLPNVWITSTRTWQPCTQN